MTRQLLPYGTWASPISPRSLAATLRLSDVQWDSDGETLVWLEGRGKQGALAAQCGLQAPRDLNDLSVRANIAYGGGEFTVAHGEVYFVSGGRLYRQALSGGRPRPLTPAFGDLAAPRVSPDGRWLVYVHSYEGVDGLAVVDSAGEHWPRKLAYGTDFVMQPVWHPGGTRIAYVVWNQPQMPWDAAELRLATLEFDSDSMPVIASVQTIAGDGTASVLQPEFSPDGRYLSYISDASGWWQIYLYDLAEGKHAQLTRAEAEHGAPAWTQGIRVYGWTHDSRAIYSIRNDRGFFSLWRIEVRSGATKHLEALAQYTHLHQLAVSPTRDAVALLASSGVMTERVISYEPEDLAIPVRLSAEDAPGMSVMVETPRGEVVHKRSSAEHLAAAQLAQPQAIEWTGHDGETVYGLYYPPASERFEGAGKPPLIVISHGGPTSQARAMYSGAAQFYATRGFAVLEVNYRGSTGYGRPYRDKLLGAWGVYDVEDCASGASHLAAQGLADAAKFVIYGGSAGGYTVLQSLVDKPGFYRAGVCLYGISDQFSLLLDTDYKFEARYSVMLLGALPGAEEVYRARSPLFHAEKIVDPVALFQGNEDKVVPKSQSDSIVAALRERGVPHEYHVYEGEGHGWRKPETIERFYNEALDFLKRWVVYG